MKNFIMEKESRTSIAKKVRLATTILLALIIVLIAILANVVISNIDNEASLDRVHAYSIDAADLFHSYINDDLLLVRMAAHSKAITDWFTDEDNGQRKNQAYNEMVNYARMLQNTHIDFGIVDSLHEYGVDSTGTFDEFAPRGMLLHGNPDDVWFFNTLISNNDYVLNIGFEKYSRQWRLWINHKVFTDGSVSGAFCSGLRIEPVFQDMFGKYDGRTVRGFIINNKGLIEMDSSFPEEYQNSLNRAVYTEVADPDFTVAVGRYLARINGLFTSSSQAEIIKLENNKKYKYASISPIAGTDWSVVILYNSSLLSGINTFLPLFIILLAALFFYVAGQNTLMNRFIFKPLKHLTNEILDGDSGTYESMSVHRSDEIGILARTIQDKTEAVEYRDNILSAANHSADLLLKAMGDRKFEASILECMENLGKCLDADRVHIWQNETIDGVFYFVHKYEWASAIGYRKNYIPEDLKIPYAERPHWEEIFSNNGHINGPASTMEKETKDFLNTYEIKSVLMVPLFVQDHFWGLFSLDDCRYERTYSEDEISILRSVGLMIANSVLRDKMTQDIRETADKLEAALEKAQNADHAKSDFLAHMSHEMRTPLNAIIGLSSLALDGNELGPNVYYDIEKVYNAGTTLLSTVNDILDISKIEANKLELVLAEYDTASLMNDTITQSIMHIGDKPIKFILDINENLPIRLFGDDLRIKQIFNNLLSNAFKYTREGSVTLGIDFVKEDQTVTLKIYVKDTGIGIKPENINAVFEDYGQVDTKANHMIMGTGLGMPITKKLVELMAGAINIDSIYGEGTTFSVTIPQKFVIDTIIGKEIVENLKTFHFSDRKRQKFSSIDRIKLPYAKVLVIDDVLTNLDVSKGLMKPYGMQIDCMTSGQDAVDAVRAEKIKYNAIFMDHMMPGMDGIEATKIIRQIGTEYAKTVPIIALTANAIVGNDNIFLSNGFQAFLSKPIEITKLDAVIKEWIRDPEQEKLYTDENAGKQNPQDESSSAKSPDLSGVQITGLDIEKGIEQFGGNVESYVLILHSFVNNTLPLLEKIKDVNKDKLDEYTITVHGIKGSCRGIGAEETGKQAEALEKAGRAMDFDFITANNQALLDAATTLINDIGAMLDKIDKMNPNKVKPKKHNLDRDLLQNLFTQCEKYDLDSIYDTVQELEKYDYETDNDLADWIKTNFQQMNIMEIKDKLQNLLAVV